MHPLAHAAAILERGDAFARLLSAARRRQPGLELRGVQGVVGPLVVALAAERSGRPLLWVAPDMRSSRRIARDLESLPAAGLCPRLDVHVLPPLEGDPYALIAPHDDVQRERVAALAALGRSPAEGAVRVLVLPARSLLLPVPREAGLATGLELRPGTELAPEDVVEHLVGAGYEVVDAVATWGEVAHRGAVLDVFAPDAEAPVRAEYWGDDVTELRAFDPATQRSTGTLDAARFGPVREALPDAGIALALAERIRRGIRYDVAPPAVERVLEALEDAGTFPGFEVLRWAVDEGRSPLSLLSDAIVAVDRPDLVEAELHHGVEALDAELPDELRPFLPPAEEVLRDVGEAVAECRSADLVLPDIAWTEADGKEFVDLGARPVTHHGGDVARCLREVREHLDHGGVVAFVMASRGRLERLHHVLGDEGLGDHLAWSEAAEGGPPPAVDLAPGTIALGQGVVSGGARLGSTLLLAEEDVFGDVPTPTRDRGGRRRLTAFAADLRDLKRGDHVVHVDHGIGRFEGVVRLGEGDDEREFMLLSYQGEDRLYLPLDRLDLVERYSGVGGHGPRIDRLGGATWEKVKRSVKKAMRDMAKELIELYAARRAARGFRFSEDGEWQREFEAAFPWEETEDQRRAIEDVKADMQSDRPMDRLVVGDVGFGKTEVALRAIFKAVMDGKQAAFLAPTTVLALQHHATVARRSQAWPLRVELLSRFRSPAQIARTLDGLKAGDVDVAVGTHRLLSRDVAFQDLGLLVVDEEQRFGVRHKERLKALRKEVDVLTLTATPIPRTLSMALGGLRDMSVIETPPVNRHAIQTHVMPFATEVVAAACRQELDRGGQVYFVHDRVDSIYSIANLVRELVPGARIGVAHGQLPERGLEEQMVAFLRGETDILVATTVIENGLDIPRANTLLVNRADRFGLAQLYQLRGRVGRSERQAQAYFFVPGRSELTTEARRRLAALQEFTDLGSGFRIAALDLEIRGAGNLLGGEQHGHIAAVGFDTYVRLLEETVAELRGEPSLPDFRTALTLPSDLRLPSDYVPDENQRLWLYKRFSTRRDAGAVDDLVREVRDRYGPPPPAVARLAEHAHLRVRAERLRIESLEVGRSAVQLRFAQDTRVHPQSLMRILQERAGAAFSPDGLLTVPLSPEEAPVEQVDELLRDLG